MPSLILVKPATAPAGEFDLSGGPQVIGRAPADCQIVLKTPAVSKRHAVVTAEGGRFFVTDEHSHNGTLLNGARLKPGVRTPLRAGDKLAICDFQFVFHEADDLPTGPPAAALHAGATPEERLPRCWRCGRTPAATRWPRSTRWWPRRCSAAPPRTSPGSPTPCSGRCRTPSGAWWRRPTSTGGRCRW
jgi:hypothetical protein